MAEPNVREACARLVAWKKAKNTQERFDIYRDHPFLVDPSGVSNYGAMSLAHQSDLELVADAYLSTVPPDSEITVTEECLKPLGFTCYDTQYEGAVDKEGQWLGIGTGLGLCWEQSRGMYISDENGWETCVELPNVKTMGDVLALLKLLNIPLNSAKPDGERGGDR